MSDSIRDIIPYVIIRTCFTVCFFLLIFTCNILFENHAVLSTRRRPFEITCNFDVSNWIWKLEEKARAFTFRYMGEVLDGIREADLVINGKKGARFAEESRRISFYIWCVFFAHFLLSFYRLLCFIFPFFNLSFTGN